MISREVGGDHEDQVDLFLLKESQYPASENCSKKIVNTHYQFKSSYSKAVRQARDVSLSFHMGRC